MKTEPMQRESNVELLKIIAIFLIAISHFLPKYGDVDLPSYIHLSHAVTDVQGLLLALFNYFGQLGNCIFLVCSAYFLVDRAATHLEKIIGMILDCLFFSLLSLAIHSALGFEIGIQYIIYSFFPVTFGNNWYIGCYILLYLVHGGLNIIIEKMNKRLLLLTVCVISGMYCVISFVLGSVYYYNAFVGFVAVYFIVAYMKRYLPESSSNSRVNRIILLASSLSLLAMLAATGWLGLRLGGKFAEQMMRWNQFRNPLIILISLSLLNLFRKKKISSKIINHLSSESLLIYIITEDLLFKRFVKPLLWLYIYQTYSYQHAAAWVLVFASAGFAAAAVIATLYMESLQRIFGKIADWLTNLIENCTNAVLERLIQIK